MAAEPRRWLVETSAGPRVTWARDMSEVKRQAKKVGLRVLSAKEVAAPRGANGRVVE